MKHGLAAAYPHDCKIRKSNGAFVFKEKSKASKLVNQYTHYRQILDALGCADAEHISFDYTRFKPANLIQLDKDFPHPLWKVLKSSLAISEAFSAQDKIQAYVDVAKAYFDKELGHGDRYLGVLEMAYEAYAVAAKYPTPENILLAKTAFTIIHSKKPPEALAQQGLFGNWIVSEYERHPKATQTKDIKEIKSQLMAAELKPVLPSQERILGREATVVELFQQRRATRVEAKGLLLAKFGDINEKNEKQVLAVVNELIDFGENFIASMLTFHQLLQKASQQSWLSEQERATFLSYSQGIEAVIVAYDALDLLKIFKDESLTLRGLVEVIATTLSSEAFQTYLGTLTFLIQSDEAVCKIDLAYSERMHNFMMVYTQALQNAGYLTSGLSRVVDYTIKPMQCTTKYPLLVAEMEKNLNRASMVETSGALINEAKQVVLSNAHDVNEAQRAKEKACQSAQRAEQLAQQKMKTFGSEDKKVGLLKAILELNLNNPKQSADFDAVAYFDRYLKALFAQAYPSAVEVDGDFFRLKASGELCEDNSELLTCILMALGINEDDNVAGRVVFDRHQFDEAMLNELIAMDEECLDADRPYRPLWLVLKSTMPVTDTFTALDKIETYIELAGQYFAGNIGKEDKYLGVYAMAEASIAMAQANASDDAIALVRTAFEPKEQGTLSKETMASLLKNKQYGDVILAKHGQHDRLRIKRKEREAMMQILRSLNLSVLPTILMSTETTVSVPEFSSGIGRSLDASYSDGLPLDVSDEPSSGEASLSEIEQPVDEDDDDDLNTFIEDEGALPSEVIEQAVNDKAYYEVQGILPELTEEQALPETVDESDSDSVVLASVAIVSSDNSSPIEQDASATSEISRSVSFSSLQTQDDEEAATAMTPLEGSFPDEEVNNELSIEPAPEVLSDEQTLPDTIDESDSDRVELVSVEIVSQDDRSPIERQNASTPSEKSHSVSFPLLQTQDEDDAELEEDARVMTSQEEYSSDEGDEKEPSIEPVSEVLPVRTPAVSVRRPAPESYSRLSKKVLMIAAMVGAMLCVGAGVALTLTGVFAPLGVGMLGLGVTAAVSAVTGVGLGAAFYLIGRKLKGWFGGGSGAGTDAANNAVETSAQPQDTRGIGSGSYATMLRDKPALQVSQATTASPKPYAGDVLFAPLASSLEGETPSGVDAEVRDGISSLISH